MSEELTERIARVEESAKSVHKRMDDHKIDVEKALKVMDEKKLSVHAFNGFVQVMDNLKDMFYSQYKKVDENTQAIISLQTTLENGKEFVPVLISTIKLFGSIFVVLLSFIGGKLMGWW